MVTPLQRPRLSPNTNACRCRRPLQLAHVTVAVCAMLFTMAQDSSPDKASQASAAEGGSGEHEFTALDNQRFARLATAMQAVATLKFLCGLFLLVAGLPHFLAAIRSAKLAAASGNLLSMLVPPVIGIWTYRAAKHLRRIVRTQGNDIKHLMAAIDELSRLYILQFGLWLAATGFAGWQLWQRTMSVP